MRNFINFNVVIIRKEKCLSRIAPGFRENVGAINWLPSILYKNYGIII